MAQPVPVAAGTGDTRDEALDRALAGSGLEAALAGAARVAVKPAGGVGATDSELLARLVERVRSGGAHVVVAEGERAPAVWRDADARISFARGRTHARLLYTGAIANLIACAPDRERVRTAARDPEALAALACDVVEAVPPAFALVDMWDGLDGRGRPRRSGRPTRTVIASPSAFAADWLLGEKMGQDPSLNPIMREALERWGRVLLDRLGNLTPFEPWRNPRLTAMVLASLLPARRASAGEVAWTAP